MLLSIKINNIKKSSENEKSICCSHLEEAMGARITHPLNYPRENEIWRDHFTLGYAKEISVVYKCAEWYKMLEILLQVRSQLAQISWLMPVVELSKVVS